MKLNPQQKTAVFSKAKSNPELALIYGLELIASQIEETINESVKKGIADAIPSIVATVQDLKHGDVIQKMTLKVIEDIKEMHKGEPGTSIKGDPGYTPVKGVDYGDGKTPVRGVDYWTEGDISVITSVLAGMIPEPIPGKTPIAGEDYPSREQFIDFIRTQVTSFFSDKKEMLKTDLSPLIKKITEGLDPKKIVKGINTLEDVLEQKTIKGLSTLIKNLQDSIRQKGGGSGGGGGVGMPVHQNFATSSATTTVSTAYKIAANGNFVFVFYNGQLFMKGTHYTVGGDQKTITFLQALQDSTNVSIIYIRT